MFAEMRRKEKQISDIESMEIIKNAEFGILSTISANGYPYAIPLNYVYYNENLYFHCAIEGHKINNMENNSKVSFCITADVELLSERFGTKYKSVIIFGIASEAVDLEKEEALTMLIKKYSGQFLEKGKEYIQNSKNKTRVFKIEIAHFTGKSNRQI